MNIRIHFSSYRGSSRWVSIGRTLRIVATMAFCCIGHWRAPVWRRSREGLLWWCVERRAIDFFRRCKTRERAILTLAAKGDSPVDPLSTMIERECVEAGLSSLSAVSRDCFIANVVFRVPMRELARERRETLSRIQRRIAHARKVLGMSVP